MTAITPDDVFQQSATMLEGTFIGIVFSAKRCDSLIDEASSFH